MTSSKKFQLLQLRHKHQKWLNAIIIYSAFLLRAFSFILLLPIFTRVIEPITWGGILVSQAMAMWFIIILDFGFNISLTRQIAIHREDTSKVRKYVGNVISAKLLLLIPIVVLCWLATQFGILRHFPSLAWWALSWAAIQGLSPLWYYQATENMYRFSAVDIMGRIVYIFTAILLVKKTTDAYLILALQSGALLIVTVLTLKWMKKEIGGFQLSLFGGIQALREGSTLSGFSILTSVYTSASVFLFGLFALPSVIPVYGNADRIARAGVSLLGPLNQLLLPRSSRAFSQSPSVGFSLSRRFLVLYSLVGLVGMVMGWIFAPILVRILFGTMYPDTVEYLRYLLVLLPLTAINTVLVYHVLIPRHEEKVVALVYGVISIIALILIILLVPMYQGRGMVFAVLLPEILASFILGILVYQRWKSIQPIYGDN